MSTVDLTGMPVSKILAMLKSRSSSGELRVLSTYRQVVFRLMDGEPSAVKSDRPTDRIGLQMMRSGEIGVIDLHGALVEQHQQRLKAIATDSQTSRLGEILVDQNVLQTDELEAALQRHIKSMVQAIEHDVILSIEFDEADDLFAPDFHHGRAAIQVD